MKLWRFDIALTLAAPFITQGQGARALGVDTKILRDDANRVALPGSLIKGNLRHAWTYLNDFGLDADVDTLLGMPAGDRNQPNRGSLAFSHWFSVTSPAEEARSTRHRIAIDPLTGTVAQGALQVIESPFPAGLAVVAKGHIEAEIDTEENALKLRELIEKGLAWIPALGAFKGAGFGRLVAAKVTATAVDPGPIEIPDCDEVGLTLSFDRPICFARAGTGREAGNRFESVEHVPGAALIAALARHWPRALLDELSRLHVTHATPAAPAESGRPNAVPHSLAWAGNRFCDLAYIDDPLIDGVAPEFCVDWKNKTFASAAKLCGRPDIGSSIEMHAEIDGETHAAREARLHTLEVRHTHSHVWRANLNLSQVSEKNRLAVREALQAAVKWGLWPLGKTDARATLKITHPHANHLGARAPSPGDATVIVVLNSDAVLLDPAPAASMGTTADLWRAAYNNYFSAHSAGALRVDRAFTRERLAGGIYFQKRFGDGAYAPKLVTEAGSTFVLSITDFERAASILEEWSALGMPSAAGEDWRTNPFRRQNGYGEIAVNPQLPE